MIEGINWIT